MSRPLGPPDPLPDEIHAYYQRGDENGRLASGFGQLERVRTQELLTHYLPAPPAVVFDVGGGSGVYACWLARGGYEVHLVDAIPLHVEQARHASQAQPEQPLASARVGDARALDRPDGSVDAVLLLGPLYHLTCREDRLAALCEAHRVLRDDGVVCAVGISRFASALDGLRRGYLDDPHFACIVRRDLADGQHRNPTGDPRYFTTAYFHRPRELEAEIREAGFTLDHMLSVEGPGWMVRDFDEWWCDPSRRQRLLEAIRWLEGEPSLLGISAHVMVIARKGA